MSQRTRRNKPAVDYALLSKGKSAMAKKRKESTDEEQELDYNDEVDIHAEEELIGGFKSEDEALDSREEGECESDEDMYNGDSDAETVAECMARGDSNKLKLILKQKEEKCQKLQTEVRKVQMNQKKKKEMETILAKTEKMDRTVNQLQLSLANSRNNSPANSPKKGKKRAKPKANENSSRKKTSGRKDTEHDKRSEYKDVLSSLIKLKTSNNSSFSELAAKAMEATNNILSLSEAREKIGGNSEGSSCEESYKDLIDKVSKFTRKDNKAISHDSLVELLSAIDNSSSSKRECKVDNKHGKVKGWGSLQLKADKEPLTNRKLQLTNDTTDNDWEAETEGGRNRWRR